MNTQNIDALFLELSQFTKAQTKRELSLLNTLKLIQRDCNVYCSHAAVDQQEKVDAFLARINHLCNQGISENQQ